MTIDHLYVDMYVYSAWEAPEISDEKLFLEIGLKEKWALWNLINTEPQTSLERFFRMFVSSNNELLLTWPIHAPLLNSQFYKGGTLSKTTGSDAETLSQASVPPIHETMNETQEHYLRQLIRLAKEHDIAITLLETPKYISLASSTSYLSAMETYITLAEEENVSYIISEETARLSGASISPSGSYSFAHDNAAFFMDSMHLSYEGRQVFTEAIVRML